MTKKHPGIAFFDFDNTIIHGDVGPLFGNYLVKAEYETIRRSEGHRAAQKHQAKLLARYTPYLAWLGVNAALYKARAVRRSQLVRTSYKALKGVESQHYYEQMAAFVDEEIPDRIYPQLHRIIKEHLDAGRKVVIVTTGITALVEQSARHLPEGIDIIGCRLHEKDGRFTGKVDGPLYGADKANIIEAYARAAGADLADCYAYSDHYSDFHMLETVGHAFCVNPRGRLATLADERGWNVLTPKAPGGST